MKKRFASFLMVLMMVVTASSLYAKQKSVAGTWMLSVPQMSFRLVLEQKGKGITGVLDSPHGLIQLKGEFAGGRLKFIGTSDAIQISATGTLKADGSLTGKLTGNVGDMDWTAIRTKAK